MKQKHNNISIQQQIRRLQEAYTYAKENNFSSSVIREYKRQIENRHNERQTEKENNINFSAIVNSICLRN